ncbi:MAG TPA: hypothetical protein VE974_28360 [Thermoanaerobaculia bacterium]|nr:hypothetical protein [Thermoanaerobaculia bacterium]
MKILLLLVAVLLPGTASAHVGSADIYFEGNAGPYPLFVTVRLPQVVPGVAELQVRSGSPDVHTIKVVLLRLTGPGSNLPSTPDVAQRSKQDPQFFVSDLWFLEYGALQARIEADGSKGKAELSVPIASFPRQAPTMSPWLRGLGLFVLIGLTLGVVPVAGGMARECTVPPGEAPQASHRRYGRIVMAVTLIATAGILYGNKALWNEEAAVYDRNVDLLKPRRVEATLQDGNRLVLRLASPLLLPLAGKGREAVEMKMEEVIPDHGHLMHLFLVGMPGMGRVWHLHPERLQGGAFAKTLPSMPAGQYQIFADIVDKNGFPWTLVGDVKLPQITGTAVAGDDSQWEGSGMSPPFSEATVAQLPDGGRVVWERGGGPLKANVPTSFKFRVEEQDGSPARDLEPYMGMAAHMVVVRSDLSVFAHVHTNGSVPMAALDLAQAGLAAGSSAGTSGAAPAMAHHHHAALPPRFSIPYGVSLPGDYRFFIQIKRSGRVQTAAFDTHVQ